MKTYKEFKKYFSNASREEILEEYYIDSLKIEEDKYEIFDATELMILTGYGNLKGNLSLLKYTEKEITTINQKPDRFDENNIKSFEEMKKELGDDYDKYMYDMNLE